MLSHHASTGSMEVLAPKGLVSSQISQILLHHPHELQKQANKQNHKVGEATDTEMTRCSRLQCSTLLGKCVVPASTMSNCRVCCFLGMDTQKTEGELCGRPALFFSFSNFQKKLRKPMICLIWLPYPKITLLALLLDG